MFYTRQSFKCSSTFKDLHSRTLGFYFVVRQDTWYDFVRSYYLENVEHLKIRSIGQIAQIVLLWRF